jgi:DNA-binding MarR family transcriptional regulator
MSNVSKENLRKVENYFVEQVRSLGNKRIEATVVEIADGSGVALATAHKAIKELDQRGRITVIKPSSRRFPITYVYRGDIQGFEVAQNKDEQIEFLKNRIAELEEQLKNSKKLPNDNILQNV